MLCSYDVGGILSRTKSKLPSWMGRYVFPAPRCQRLFGWLLRFQSVLLCRQGSSSCFQNGVATAKDVTRRQHGHSVCLARELAVEAAASPAPPWPRDLVQALSL